GEEIDEPRSSFDTVVSTFTLCSIANVSKALDQLRGALKNNGKFLFVEHGRSPEASVQRWQDRLTPVQKFLIGGCHLNRDIRGLITAAGFEIVALEQYYLEGPKPMGFIYRGVARIPA